MSVTVEERDKISRIRVKALLMERTGSASFMQADKTPAGFVVTEVDIETFKKIQADHQERLAESQKKAS